MAVITAIAVGTAAVVGGGLVSANQAKQAAKGFKNEKERKEWEINELESNRQAIPNPYANVEDLTSMMNNPFANLGVATQASRFQAEEEDISLANTLDTLAATGASAGGATALAQAALQSKRGVSANIEKQESQIQTLRAEGEANLNLQKIAEKQRIQTAETQGELFQYGEQESRDISKLNRLSGQEAQAKNDYNRSKESQTAAYGAMFSGIGNIAGGVIGSGG